MNKAKTTVLLTFDYEMFLGKSGTIDKCMIEPAEEILKILKRNSAYATFFIDVCFLIFLKKNGDIKNFNKIKYQIQNIISNGHRVELHIHPHWIDALYKEKEEQWIFTDYRYYMQANLPDRLLRDIFLKGYDILSKIAIEIDSKYQIIAYRAGGWCLEPFEKLKQLFIETNIKIDSSVLPGLVSTNNIASYNYLEIKNTDPYFFNDSIFEKNDNGLFLEIPLSIYSHNFFQRLNNRINMAINANDTQISGNGQTIFNKKEKHILSRFHSILSSKKNAATIDGYADKNLLHKLNKSTNIVTIVGHPKLHTNKSFIVLDEICGDKDNRCINFNTFFLEYKRTIN